MTVSPTLPALSAALRFVQMTGVFYCPSELTEPWGLELPPMDSCVWFHAVTSGECTLEVDGEQHHVRRGDLIVLPRGTGHRVWGRQTAPTPIVYDLPHEYRNENYAVLTTGGGGSLTQLVCGGIRFDRIAAQHLIGLLPPVIHIDSTRSDRSAWVHATLDLLANEMESERPGSEAIISRLCDIVVIQAIRAWIESDDNTQTGWLKALHDQQIGTAIARIHANPEHDWSVASLATEVAMSRSAFAARFTELVGQPAMRYVTQWRMAVATQLLADTTNTIASIAPLVGYDSEAAFSRAFTREQGQSPRAARNSLRAEQL